jgi:hypothetical protein
MTTQKLGNIIARNNGYGRASMIIIDKRFRKGTGKVEYHIPYGWRKNTTDEYVSNSYRRNFGWKNTYYQHAITVIRLNVI